MSFTIPKYYIILRSRHNNKQWKHGQTTWRDVSPKKKQMAHRYVKRCPTSLLKRCKSKVQWHSNSCCSEWPSVKSPQARNAGAGVEKRAGIYTVSGCLHRHSHCSKLYGFSQKTKNGITIWSSIPVPGDISRQNYNSKTYMHRDVQSSSAHSGQDMGTNIHQQMNG